MRNTVLKMTRKRRVNGELVDVPLAPRTAQLALTICVMALHYKAVLRRAGLPEVTRVHDLRHTMVTTALNNGQPLTVVSKYVGHSSVAITADIYGHRDDIAERKVAESMGAILKKRKKKGRDEDAEQQ